MPERITAVPKLPPRATAGHKGTFGRVLAVAGSRGMAGAAALCGGAALRGGAGLVTVAVPECVEAIVAALNPCYMVLGLPDAAGVFSEAAAESITNTTADVLAVGPGLHRGPGPAAVVRTALALPKPLVLDADGLNTLGIAAPAHFTGRTPAITVLTPHPGEFAKLLGTDRDAVQADREGLAVAFAAKCNITLLLKGHNTVVTDGRRVFVNPTGNPGMGTGGTGDVLTGLIAALLAQGLTGFDAAVLGAWVHGRAGDLAAEEIGPVGLTAADVRDRLPAALRERV